MLKVENHVGLPSLFRLFYTAQKCGMVISSHHVSADFMLASLLITITVEPTDSKLKCTVNVINLKIVS